MATSLILLVALAGPPLFVAVPAWLFGEFPRLGIQVAVQLAYCGMAGCVVWSVVRLERLPLRSIGVRRPDWSTFVSAAVVALAGLYVLPLITTPLVNVLGADDVEAGLRRLAPLPAWFRIVLAVTGGAVEETLYRGYAVERLATLTGRPWLGGMIAAVAFALAHIPFWGAGFALGGVLPFGIAMTLFYLWKRDLLANALAHSAALVVSMLMLP